MGKEAIVSTRTRSTALIGIIMASLTSASAMTLREFKKFSIDEQGTYIGAAVNMLAYTYAANGNVPKASCIKNWYFGTRGTETPGPREIRIEIGVAEKLDADKYHVEGVILGVTDKACPASTAAKPKP
jgi:hypothetical protein